MGQKDISLVRFFEDQERYADLINGFVFKGEQIVSQDDVQEMDSRVTGVAGLFGRLRNRLLVQKYRDCVRRVVFGMDVAIIGIENQDRVHHGMPARIMMEDAAGYDRQLRQIRRHHRRKRDLDGDEFVGGFASWDKVNPVLTICIYYGKTPYNGAKELYQMMEYQNLPGHLKEMLNNYKIQVLEINTFEDIDRFKTDLREVFGFIKCSGNAEAERKFTFENEDKFKALEEDAYDVIASVTGSKELEDAKYDCREEGGKYNMCEAIRGMIEQGREEGLSQGWTKGNVDGQNEKARKTARNMYARGFTPEETASLLEEKLETVVAWFGEWSEKK